MNDGWVRVAIGLGSNLDSPKLQIQRACATLQSLAHTRWIGISELVFSKPQGPQDQPDFVNAVCILETRLSPNELLHALQHIEQSQGRIKRRHWGERLIDLDILLYGEQQLVQPDLVIPHPQMAQRDFVILPLAQIWPDAMIPGQGKVADVLKRLTQHFVLTQSQEGKT